MCHSVHFADLPTDVEDLLLDLIHDDDAVDELMFDDDYSILFEAEPVFAKAADDTVRRATEIETTTSGDVPPIHVA